MHFSLQSCYKSQLSEVSPRDELTHPRAPRYEGCPQIIRETEGYPKKIRVTGSLIV